MNADHDYLETADPSWYPIVLKTLARLYPEINEEVWGTAVTDNAIALTKRRQEQVTDPITDTPYGLERGSATPLQYVDGPGCTPAALAGRQAAQRALDSVLQPWERDLIEQAETGKIPAVPATTEVQPATPAGATVCTHKDGCCANVGACTHDCATVDPHKPYCYSIHRPRDYNGPRTDGEEQWLMSWGSWDTPPGPIITAHHAATYQAARARIEHAYYGPMIVTVWNRRDDEHYRMPPPENAFVLELGDRRNDIDTAIVEASVRLDEVEKGMGPQD